MATFFDTYPFLKEIAQEKLPKHVLFIPDGNGRWAHAHKLPVTQGHKKGFQAAQRLLSALSEVPEVEVVTLWGFSADNWKRSQLEVAGLMYIFEQAVKKIRKEFRVSSRRFIHIGRKDRIPLSLAKLLEVVEQETENHTGQILCLAIDFGGEDQIVRMLTQMRKLSQEVVIDESLVWKLRDGKGRIPPADLLIRTSGEIRTSDVGWLNSAPTELYFYPKHFPDMTTEDLALALLDFSKRERRMGKRL